MRLLALTTIAMLSGAACVSAQQSGTTSGPAAGKQTTLGTGGQTTATPHMQDSLRNKGGTAVKAEQSGQAGGTGTTVRPGASDAGAGKHVTQ